MLKTQEARVENASFWQLVFLQSRVNGAAYHGERLPGHNWNWPKNTYLQRRLEYLRWYRPCEFSNLN